MTHDQIREAETLIDAHNSLRWNLARNSHREIRLCAVDDDKNTTQPCLPPQIGHHVMLVSIALVEARLGELGVKFDHRLEHDCFACGGSGKQDMK